MIADYYDSGKKIIIISAIVLIIASGFLGYVLGQSSMKKYKIAVDELLPEPEGEIYSVFGTILSLSANSLTITVPKPGERFLPGEEIIYEELQVSVGEETSLGEFDDLSENPEEDIKKISLSELSEGDRIAVQSEENIIGKKEIVAEEIIKEPSSF